MQQTNTPASVRAMESQSRTSNTDSQSVQHVRLAEVVNIGSKAKKNMLDELSWLMVEAAAGRLTGISYAATSGSGHLIAGSAGNHFCNPRKASAELLRASLSLAMAT